MIENRVNCWEAMDCGVAPGGPRVAELGVCPVAVSESLDGVNGGRSAGRVCWSVPASLCHHVFPGQADRSILRCTDCGFLSRVMAEERERFVFLPSSRSH